MQPGLGDARRCLGKIDMQSRRTSSAELIGKMIDAGASPWNAGAWVAHLQVMMILVSSIMVPISACSLLRT